MACKKKNLDQNRIVDVIPDVLQDKIQFVRQMLKDCEESTCKCIRNCKELKTGLQTLLNLLSNVQTLCTPSDVEKYLTNLECLQAEFLAISNNTGWTCTEALGILDKLKAYARCRKDVMQQKFFETSERNDEPNFGTNHSPSSSLTSTIADGYSNIGRRDGINDLINENGSDAIDSRPPTDGLVPAVKNGQSPDNDDPPDGGAIEESTDTNNPPQNAALVVPNNGIPNLIHQLNAINDAGGTFVDTMLQQGLEQPNDNTLLGYHGAVLMTREDIKDMQEWMGLGSFLPYECGEQVANQRPRNSPDSPIPLYPSTVQVTTNAVPASGGPNDLDIVGTQQAEMVLNTEKHSLFPPNTIL